MNRIYHKQGSNGHGTYGYDKEDYIEKDRRHAYRSKIGLFASSPSGTAGFVTIF